MANLIKPCHKTPRGLNKNKMVCPLHILLNREEKTSVGGVMGIY
jgi:hypothetical protein